MTQPRKEQINDQRTYYTRVDAVGVAMPIPFGTPDVPGGTTQTIQNTISENYYNEFLAETITGTPGGAEQDTPAYFYGNSGPFSPPVSAGSTFTITLPGINSGNPVAILFQPSDVFDIGGIPYITTSQVAKRINLALTAAGVNPLTPVAVNINGQIALLSANSVGYTYGESAFITVNDLTVGVCSALGFAPGNTATAVGISSPKRGIVTTVMNNTPISPNGPQLGGLVQLLLPDASPAITQSPVQVNVSGLGNLPLYPAGQSIIGGLQQFTNTSGNSKFVVQYQRQGAVPGKIRTRGGNFSTLLNTDTFQVTVNTINPALFGLPGNATTDPEIQTYTFTVSFLSTPTGAQDVINAVNTAWNANAVAQGFPAGTEAGRGGIYGFSPGPWQFINGSDQFWILFNGQDMATKSIQIYPPGFNGVVTWTASDLATFINAAIATAGQTAQGSASVGPSGTIQITSNLTSGPTSIVQVLAGDVFGNEPLLANNDTHMLDKLGISPGVYSGSVIAKPYGNSVTPEDIVFVCPDHTIQDPYGAPSGIVVTGSATVMAKLGLSGTTVTGNVTIGLEPVTPPIVHALIPEMMYFGEVPENIETSTDRFLTTDEPAPVMPGGGTGNIGASPLLGLDGKINPNLLHKVLDVLNVDSLTLGARQTGFLQGNETARVITPFSPFTGGGMTLLWEGVSTSGLTGPSASQIMRLYIDWTGGIWLTTNAAQTGVLTPIQWNKDTPSQSASAVFIGQSTTAGVPKVEFLYAPAAATNPFIFGGSIGTAANAPVGLDPSGALGGALAFILAGTANTASNENVIPRLLAQVAPNTYTLVWQTVQAGATENIRVYSYVTTSSHTEYWLTINAYWTGIAWTKDVSGANAYALQLQTGNNPGTLPTGIGVQTGMFLYYRAPGDNTPWVTWTPNGGSTGPNSFLPFGITGQNGGPNGTGGVLQVNNIRLGELIPPLGISDLNARISVPNRPVAGTRVLVAEYGTGPQGSQILSIGGGPGPATLSSVLGGPGANLSTLTNLAGMNATMQGQYMTIAGASHANNNGTFQIANVISATSVQIVNPLGTLPDANSAILTYAVGGMGQIGPVMRMYVGCGFTGSEGFGPGNYSFVMLTSNARWTGSNWQCDFPVTASMQIWTGNEIQQGTLGDTSGFIQFFNWIPSGYGIPWNDDNWYPLASFGLNGIQLPAQASTSSNIQGIPNLIAPPTIPKAWVNFDIFFSGGVNINVADQWNVNSVTSVSVFGVTCPQINFNAGMANAVYASLVTFDGAYWCAPIPSTSNLVIAVYDHTNTIVNFAAAGFASMSVAVLSRQ